MNADLCQLPPPHPQDAVTLRLHRRRHPSSPRTRRPVRHPIPHRYVHELPAAPCWTRSRIRICWPVLSLAADIGAWIQ